MLCGLEKKSVQKLGRKKGKKRKEKKEKNLIVAKSGLVVMKVYLKTYNHMKYFFAVLKPFLTETAFYAKLSWRYSGSKTKFT